MAVRSIQYLVVDDVMADVPDGAPEIDASVQTAADVAAALTSAAGVPPGAEIYLQTFRPDGSMRWQPLASVSSLPDMPCLRAKVLRRQPGAQHGLSTYLFLCMPCCTTSTTTPLCLHYPHRRAPLPCWCAVAPTPDVRRACSASSCWHIWPSSSRHQPRWWRHASCWNATTSCCCWW